MNKISVLIVEDHTVVREGLSMMLGLESDMEVVGEAQDGRKAIALATELMPNVILMDIAMPGLNGLEAARQLLQALPTLRVIILSAHSDDVYVNRAVDCGAKGFLLKQDPTSDVYKAIREVHRGGIFYSSSIAKRFTRMNTKIQDRSGKLQTKRSLLTSREMEVLQLVAEGKANKETAAELKISIKTVEKHRGNLMDKLDIHDTAGLTRYAISGGIIESSVQITMI
ncbi:MAG: response regulator transcription factor [Verrucomicrobiota bacterium]